MSENQNEQNNTVYDEDQIQILEGLEAVRKRPGMYIGSTSQKGLHHLIYEIVDNSIDEALAGFAIKLLLFFMRTEAVSVQDNGRGIPSAIHHKCRNSDAGGGIYRSFMQGENSEEKDIKYPEVCTV